MGGEVMERLTVSDDGSPVKRALVRGRRGVGHQLWRVAEFVRRETVLSIAALLAVASCALVPPDAGYASYIDIETLGKLFSLMLVMAGLQRAFFAELFRLAGRLPVLAAMEQSSPDLYRLMRLLEDARMWAYLTGCHAAMVQSLTRHDHEGAVAALEAEFDLFKPLLEECLYLQPHYFEQDAAALSEPRGSRSSESIDEP